MVQTTATKDAPSVGDGSHAAVRCDWCGTDPDYVAYHDTEWGVPTHDDTELFEFLILEGAQAGLSWSTILKRRDGYRDAYANWDPEAVAAFTDAHLLGMRENTGIVRNKSKIAAARTNAQAFLEVQSEFGSFDAYLWNWVDGEPIVNRPRTLENVPATTELSEALSRDLRNRGFTFVGPTIVYAYLQSMGLVNDHLVECFRHDQVATAPVTAPELPKIGAPATRALESIGVTHLSDLAGKSETELLSLHGFGPRALGLIADALHERGLAFGADPDDAHGPSDRDR